MIRIKECVDRAGHFYLVNYDGQAVSIVRTRCVRSVASFDEVDIPAFVFYKNDWSLLYEPSRFVTFRLKRESENSRLIAISALKLFCSYCSLTNTTFDEFDANDLADFISFARGDDYRTFNYEFSLASHRTERTLATYLEYVKKFLEEFANFEFRPKEMRGLYRPKRSTLNPRGTSIRPHIADTAPDYVTIDEYKRLLRVSAAHGNPYAVPMVRCMFEHGLRIGEVLGLTVEDIKERESAKGFRSFSLVLRNRVSDRIDQRAKGVMDPNSKSQYTSSAYLTRNVGYQEVLISESLFNALIEYVETSRFEIDCASAQADAVEAGTDGNEYVFVNGKGRALSSNLWNKHLRKLFKEAGLAVDAGRRKTNINHKLRHGYAMFLAKERKLDDFAIKTLMRHRSILSTETYVKPTADDVAEMQRLVTWDIMEAVGFGKSGESNE